MPLKQLCKVCLETKAVEEFNLRTCTGKRRNQCTSCYNKLAAARRYGLSLDEYNALEREHGCRCAICKVHADHTGHAVFTRLVVDHDHRTGKVRGMLCSRCNAALGHFDDSPSKLLAAAAYLSKEA